MTGSYAGDNACCSLASDAPSVTPVDSHSPTMFTFSNANLQTDVYSNDYDTATGPGGNLYSVTYTAPAGCYTKPADVTYDVQITNVCGEASFTIDPASSVFKTQPTASFSYTIAEPEASFAWDTSTDYSSSVAPVDPCGVIEEFIEDVSTGTPSAIDSSIFTYDTVSDATQNFLKMQTADLTEAGTHEFQLTVRYQDYPTVLETRTFEVLFVHPCETAVLTLDTTTHLPSGTGNSLE